MPNIETLISQLHEGMTLHLDYETYYSDEYTLARQTTFEYIRDPRFHITGLAAGVGEHGEIVWIHKPHEVAAFHAALATIKKWTLVAHNAKFDGFILHEHYDIHPSTYVCTMSMATATAPYLSSSLVDLAKRTFPNDPNMQKGQELVNVKGLRYEDIPEHELIVGFRTFASYGVQDVKIMRACYYVLLNRGFPKLELDVIHIVIRMVCLPRIEADTELLDEVIEDDIRETHEAVEKAVEFVTRVSAQPHVVDPFKTNKQGLVVYPFDKKLFSSNDRLVALLVEVFGLEVPTKKSKTTGKDAWALGQKDVEFLEFMVENPGLKVVWEAREVAKSTIALAKARRMIDAADPITKRMPVPLKYYGAHTGRMSGGEKMNMQNMQRGSRHRLACRAPNGYLVYAVDLSNIEARVLAWFAGQWDLVQAFAEGADVYADFASDAFGFKVVKKDHPFERNLGKVCILGLGYMMGLTTFTYTLKSGPMGMPPVYFEDPNKYKELHQAYRKKYPQIVELWATAEYIIQQMMRQDCNMQWGPLTVLQGMIILPNGTALHYPNLKRVTTVDEETGKSKTQAMYWNGRFKTSIYGGKLVENIVQALAGVIIKEAMQRTEAFLHSRFAESAPLSGIVLQVHDENVPIAPDFGATKSIMVVDGKEKEVWSNDGPEKLLQELVDLHCVVPEWAEGLPIDAEGGYDYVYSK